MESVITGGISMHTFFYCTHSIGPIIHITDSARVSVTGFEMPFNARAKRMGRRCGIAGVEMLTLENGAVVKSVHGDLIKNSIWYTLYGSKGRMESSREDAQNGGVMRLHTNFNPDAEHTYPDDYQTYLPTDALSKAAESYGHGAADYYTMYYFTRKILGVETCGRNRCLRGDGHGAPRPSGISLRPERRHPDDGSGSAQKGRA